jgi:hypothetical protein
MENNKALFIKTDDNKIINEKYIRWIKKINECLEVCTKSNGCYGFREDTHKICKLNSPFSYNKLNENFK